MTGSDPAAVPVLRLVIWRHGRTEWNAAGRFQGQLDPPLDDEGRRQAARTAPYLAAALPEGDTVVVSSDLSRAAETAVALTGVLHLPLHVDPRLREHGLGCWEGLTRDEVADRYPDQYADWLAGRPVRGRDGEEAEQVARRALAALLDLPPVRVGVVVTHGGTAGRMLEALLGLGPDHRRVFGALANCGWSELHRQDSRWRVIRHNSVVPAPIEGRRPVPAPAPGRGVPEEAPPPPGGSDADAVG